MRRMLTRGALVGTLCLASLSFASAQDDVLTLPEALAAARAAHPALAAARARVDSREASARADGAWADPMVGLMVKRDTNEVVSASMVELEISQALPLSGNLARREAVSTAEAAASAAAVNVTELLLLSETRRVYVDLAALHARLVVLDRTDRLLGEIVADLESKYAAGSRPQSDVLTAELERLTLQEQISTLRGNVAAGTARLNALMNRPAGTPLPPLVPLDYDFDQTELTAYIAAASAQHPSLLMAAAEIETAAARAELAAHAGRPDPVVQLRLNHRDGSGRAIDSFDTGIAVSVPWIQRDRYRDLASAARSARLAAEQDEATTRQDLLGRVSARWHQLAAFRDCCLLYRDQALPLAHSAVDAAQRDFAGGRIGLADLLNATRNLHRVEDDLVRFLREYHLGFADLLESSGLVAPLPASS